MPELTAAQRENIGEALRMLDAVDPARVHLSYWCQGETYCLGGLVATWPAFQRQGVWADELDGRPRMSGIWRDRPSDIARLLFGCDELFTAAGEGRDDDRVAADDWGLARARLLRVLDDDNADRL